MKLLRQILLRIIFLPLILAAGIAATALVTVRIMFTPEDLQSVVTNQFQEMLRRPVHIEWARLSATGKIEIKGLSATEPGPETVNFLQADYIYATYRLLPLLRRKIEIDSVVLVSPKIQLIRRADGSWNISDIFAAYRQAGGRHSLEKIDKAEIKDGELSVLNAKSGSRYSFDNLNATLKDFKPSGDSPFSMSVFFKSTAFKRPVDGRLYAEGDINFSGFDWTKAEVKELRADLTLLNKTAHFTGGLRNFRRPEIALKADMQEFRSSEMAYLFSSPWEFNAPRSLWDITAVFGSSGTVRMDLAAKPLGLKVDGAFDFSAPTLQYAFTVSAPPLKRYVGKLPVENPAGRMQVRLKLGSRDARPVLSRIFLTSSGAAFRYKTMTAADLDMTALLAENFANSYLTTSDGKLSLGKNKLTGLKLSTQLSKDELSLNYSGRFNGEPVRGRTAIKRPFSPSKTVDFIGYSKNLVFSEAKDLVLASRELHETPRKTKVYQSQLAWLKTLKNSIPSGYADFKLLYKADKFRHDYLVANDFYASASLKNITGDITKINGDISIRSGSGTFYHVEKTSETDRIYYIISMPLRLIYNMNKAGALKFGATMDNVSFNSIGGDYSLKDGKVQLKNFYMSGKEYSAYASGQLDFSNETMKLKIYTISGKYYSMGSLPEALTDASGKPALAFTIEGKMTKPDFNMISPKESGNIIRDAAKRGVAINFDRIDRFLGGKQ
jgi:hypothetical protein